MIMDSDKDKKGGRLDKSKSRIKTECEGIGAVCWVTSGREIENYLPPEAVSEAYAAIKGDNPGTITIGPYDRLDNCVKTAYGKKWKPSWSYGQAKAYYAREIVKHIGEEGIGGELLKSLERVVAAIRGANL
jgi:hypothetical protein